MTASPDLRTFDHLFGGRAFDAYSDGALRKLAERMTSPLSAPVPEAAGDPDDGTIPAGYTYLGQFIDHDLVFDEVSTLDRLNLPHELTNTATARFDLDSLYGRPSATVQPPFEPTPSAEFRLGVTVSSDPRIEGPDLPRVGTTAQIGDKRNDENLIVSQLHSLFLRFHNAMARHLAAAQPGLTGADLFAATRGQVSRHFQWIVVNDFLPRIVGQDVVEETVSAQDGGGSRRFFDPRSRLFMPLEFSGAAYRFGHSMIRPIYRLNGAIRRPLFTGTADPHNLDNLIGFRPLPNAPQGWGVEWKFFFELGDTPPDQPIQKARRIDTHLVDPLRSLIGIVPDGPLSLAERNLRRGRALGLASGQQVAQAMGLAPILDKHLLVGPREGAQTPINEVDPEFAESAPLWYYVLREAEIAHDGHRLGPVGGRLVAETMIGLLAADLSSYLNAEPAWTPDPAFAVAGRFGMPELIRAVVAHP